MFENSMAMFRASGGTHVGACGWNVPGACGILLPPRPPPTSPLPRLHPKFANGVRWLRPPQRPPHPCLLHLPLPPPPFPRLNPPDAAPAKGYCTGIVSCWIGGWYCFVWRGGVCCVRHCSHLVHERSLVCTELVDCACNQFRDGCSDGASGC